MYVKSLELKDYRNYSELNMKFYSGTNILYGDNAQGKTNILEAIYLCGTTKSHKGSKDREMIQLGKEESHIRIFVEKNEVVRKIDMHLKKSKPKGVAIDGMPIRKSSELFGLIHMVFFSPEDLGIIKNGPTHRRRFIDLELAQIDKVYLHHLSCYNKVLLQRNNLLKQINNKQQELFDTLSIWDAQLVQYGREIIKRRAEFISQLNSIIGGIHNKLSANKENLCIEYEPSVSQEEYEEKINRTVDRDIALKTTNIGPHRDDISFIINEKDIRKYGSQGQQRTTALSLKLAEIELVKIVTNDKPVLLLDDVLSELDRKRQNQLLNSISDIQTIVTCTGLEEFVNNRFGYDKVCKVVEGHVYEQNLE